jgi:hypothetical protein
MADCAICMQGNKKLHKRLYKSCKVYICTKCTIDFNNLLETEQQSKGENNVSIN